MEEFRPIALDWPLIKLARKNAYTLKLLNSSDEEKNRKSVRKVLQEIIVHMREQAPY